MTIEALFKDFAQPVFTQREAAELSGLEWKAISNLVERRRPDTGLPLMQMPPINGRPQSGRRMFSRLQVLIFAIVAAAPIVPVSDALAMAEKAIVEAKLALDEGRLIFHVPRHQRDFTMWLVFHGRKARPDEKTDTGIAWEYSVVTSPFRGIMFSNMGGKAFEIDADFSHSMLNILPIGDIAQLVGSRIAGLLAKEAGEDGDQ